MLRLNQLPPIWALRIWTLVGFVIVSSLLTFIASTSMIQLRREKYLEYLRAAEDMRQAIFAELKRSKIDAGRGDAAFFEKILKTSLQQMSATSKIGVDILEKDHLIARYNRLSLRRRRVIENDDGVDFLTSSLPPPRERYTIAFFTDAIPLPLPARLLGLQIGLYVVLVPCTFGALYHVGARSIRLTEERLQVAAMVGHELRTPLTSLKMHLEMLQAGMVLTESNRTDYMNRLLTQVDRLSHTVQDMLTVSKPSDFVPSAVVMTQSEFLGLCTAEIDRISSLFNLEIPFQFNEPIDPDSSLLIDKDSLRAILINLIENSIKYGSARTKGIRVSATSSKRHLDLRVTDFGSGIRRNERRLVFRPFRRGKRAESDAVSGTGLGLTVVRTFARRLGGEVWIEDSRNGCSIRLRLPLKLEAAA